MTTVLFGSHGMLSSGFAERLGGEADRAEQKQKSPHRVTDGGAESGHGAIAVLALRGQRCAGEVLQANACPTVLTWNQFVPSLSDSAARGCPAGARILDRLIRPRRAE